MIRGSTDFLPGSQVQQVDLLAQESEPNIPLAMLWQTPWPVALAFNTWKTTGLDQVCFDVPEFCPLVKSIPNGFFQEKYRVK